jgi:hypothetical protein
MNLGFFTMPIHPISKDWRVSLAEDRAAFILADELGFTEGYVGEHVTDQAENITSSAIFIATLINATKSIRLGTGTVNLPNSHPAHVASNIAMLDHLLDGRFIFGISPGGLLSDAEVFGNLDANRNEMFLEASVMQAGVKHVIAEADDLAVEFGRFLKAAGDGIAGTGIVGTCIHAGNRDGPLRPVFHGDGGCHARCRLS